MPDKADPTAEPAVGGPAVQHHSDTKRLLDWLASSPAITSRLDRGQAVTRVELVIEFPTDRIVLTHEDERR
jgi:hypothetical protein